MGVIVFADTWRMLPSYVLMMLASLQTIPQSQIEAAILDGAGAVFPVPQCDSASD